MDEQVTGAEVEPAPEQPDDASRTLALSLEGVPVAIWQLDASGRVLIANQKARTDTGMRVEATPSGPWLSAMHDHIHADDRLRAETAWERGRGSGQEVVFEARVRRSDDTYRWLEVRVQPQRDRTGTVTAWYGSSVDIAAQKLVELELAAQLGFSTLRSELIDVLAAATGVTFDAAIRAALGRVGEFFGAARVEIVRVAEGRPRATLYAWSGPGAPAPESERDAALGRVAVAEPTHRLDASRAVVPLHGAGQTIALLTLSSLERALPERAARQLALLGDVFASSLARRAAARALDDSRAALDVAQRDLARVTRSTALGELVASIAHEVNQPLAAITADAAACLNWLALEPPDLEQVRASLSAMARDGERATHVVARIRALLGRDAAVYGPCSLAAVVDAVLPLVAGQLRRDGILLRTSLAPELPRVLGDSVQLQQVLLNLLLNAADACRDAAAERRVIDVRTSSTSMHGTKVVLVTVEDFGVGLQGIDAARLFETFYTTKATGLGMGLSISRTIVERHGGSLWAESRPIGALFAFAIPASG